MKSYPKIRAIDHLDAEGILDERGELLIQETVDGATFRIYLDVDDDGAPIIEFGPRNVSFGDGSQDDISENFRQTIECVTETLTNNEIVGLVQDEGSVTVFGESVHKHTIEYDWSETPRFLGFDVWAHRDEEWCHMLPSQGSTHHHQASRVRDRGSV